MSPDPRDVRPPKHQFDPHIDKPELQVSQSPFGPPNSNDVDMQTLTSPNGSMQSSGDQATPGVQNLYYGSGIPDLSAMMFPSSDPFVYPEQPMTTLENRDWIKQETPMDASMYNLSGPPTTGGTYENYDAQFGQVPSYVMQGQPSNLFQSTNTPSSMSSGDTTAPLTTTSSVATEQWSQNQQQPPLMTSGMGFDQLYGEDWGGWMNQYR